MTRSQSFQIGLSEQEGEFVQREKDLQTERVLDFWPPTLLFFFVTPFAFLLQLRGSEVVDCSEAAAHLQIQFKAQEMRFSA